MCSYDEYIEEIKSIWNDGAMTNNGPKVKKLRENLISYMGCKNAELFVNGHSALYIGIKTFDLPKGGEVLTSPFTFVSTTNAIIQNELVPVFCDIDDSYNISIESIRKCITAKTCAIITPHIFGIPCNVRAIDEVAKEYGLKVIYDAAQAFGSKIDGVNIGCFGDATMFSMHAIKVYNSVEGGILTYNDDTIREKLELYRNFGISYGETNDVVVSGINAKMTEFSAAMGLINLRNVDAVIKKRKELAKYYIQKLKEVPGVFTYQYKESIDYDYAYFPVKIDVRKLGMSRDELWKYLDENGVQTRKLYDTLTCDFTLYKNSGYKTDVDYAREVTKIALDLPMYSELKFEDIDKMVNLIKSRKE